MDDGVPHRQVELDHAEARGRRRRATRWRRRRLGFRELGRSRVADRAGDLLQRGKFLHPPIGEVDPVLQVQERAHHGVAPVRAGVEDRLARRDLAEARRDAALHRTDVGVGEGSLDLGLEIAVRGIGVTRLRRDKRERTRRDHSQAGDGNPGLEKARTVRLGQVRQLHLHGVCSREKSGVGEDERGPRRTARARTPPAATRRAISTTSPGAARPTMIRQPRPKRCSSSLIGPGTRSERRSRRRSPSASR